MNAETNTNPISWLHGLQDYLEFTNDIDAKKYVDFFLGLLYSNNSPIEINNTLDINEFIFQLRKYADNNVIDIIYKYFREGHDPKQLQDAFSRGQVNSKIWLAQELLKIKDNFNTIHVHAGWFGQIRLYLDAANINFKKIRIFDADPAACKISDTIINNQCISNFKVKATKLKLPNNQDSEEVKNMSWVTRTGIEYEVKNFNKDSVYKEKTMPDLIINSSAEHMSSIWYHKMINRPMQTDPLFIIQTNNLFDVEEHHLCVHSLDHMQKKFPMSRLEYAGEKELYGYKRFMMIGRP